MLASYAQQLRIYECLLLSKLISHPGVQILAGLQIEQLQEALEKMKDGTKMALKAADDQRSVPNL